MKGYKVVRYKNGRFFSACIKTSAMVEYKVSEWAMPHEKCGALCVFEDKGAAVDLLATIEKIETDRFYIFRCEYVPTVQDIYDHGVKLRTKNVPSGTRRASKVKILKGV